MSSTVEVGTGLTELADRLRTAAQALKHPSADHILSSEERAALCKEVNAIAAELSPIGAHTRAGLSSPPT